VWAELDNSSVEWKLRSRYATVFPLFAPLVVGGAILIASQRPGPSDLLGFVPWAVGSVIAAPFLWVAGYFAGRAIVFLSVPRAITITDNALLGNFRRVGWTGAPTKVILFDNVREMRTAYLLRIPMIFARASRADATSISSAPFFYLSESNFGLVTSAVERYARQRGAHDTGDAPRLME
jgi:hypothetical protein